MYLPLVCAWRSSIHIHSLGKKARLLYGQVAHEQVGNPVDRGAGHHRQHQQSRVLSDVGGEVDCVAVVIDGGLCGP